jgi:hypothetical protein
VLGLEPGVDEHGREGVHSFDDFEEEVVGTTGSGNLGAVEAESDLEPLLEEGSKGN